MTKFKLLTRKVTPIRSVICACINGHFGSSDLYQQARIQILEVETRRLKENLQVALDKSLTDDQLLDALKAEVQRLSTLLKRQQEAAESRKESNVKGSITTNSIKVDQYENEIRRLERLVRHQVFKLHVLSSSLYLTKLLQAG